MLPVVMPQSTASMFTPDCFMAAVNPPGTAYTLNEAGTPNTTTCPEDSYGPGLKKQRACVPCPPGYTTNGAVGQRSVRACGKEPATKKRWLKQSRQFIFTTCAPAVGLQSTPTPSAW